MICSALDCENTIDVVDCWFDDGRVCFSIRACLSYRITLQELDLLDVDRCEDRPSTVRERPW